MGWLRPYGKRPGPRDPCPHCGGKLSSGLVPVRWKTGSVLESIHMRWCASCGTGWSDANKSTDYRMFQVTGADGKKAWRAKPR